METIHILQDMERLNHMKYKIVTCFNETILKQNASRLLDQFKSKWQPTDDIEFHCYYYDMDLKNYSLPKAKNIKYHNLNNIPEYTRFIETNKAHDGTEGGTLQYNPMLDVLSESAKVFAISECAFDNTMSWLIWIDPYSYIMKDIRLTTLAKYLPKKVNTFALSMLQDSNHFMAFNLSQQPVVDLIGDWRGAYITNTFINYREWSNFVPLRSILPIYIAHGLKISELTNINDLLVDIRSNDSRSLRDSEGNRVISLSDTETSPDILPGRYKQLSDLVRYYEPKTILETGTWNAGRAIEMSLACFEKSDAIHYIGYDLFEEATAEIDKEEFNAKPHNTKAAVVKRLQEFKEYIKENKKKEFTFEIIQGNVRDTLKSTNIDKVDFALIGSGNSIKTVAHEYSMLKDIPVVVADHYFTKDEAEELPPEEYQGVNKVFNDIATKKVNAQETTEDGWTNFDEKSTTRKYVLPSSDRVLGGGTTHLVVILHDSSLKDIPEEIKRVPIVVHPRDCVPKEYISSNIQTNMKLIDEKKWVQKHPPHRDIGIIVSAGPYLDYDKLKKFIKDNPTSKVLTVKHAYPNLLENGIKPWGCIVLDPRPITGVSTHNIVRKDLFKTIDPSTRFFVASMTDPSVTKYMKDGKGNIWEWHAFTDSLREEQEQGTHIENQTVKLNEDLGIPQGATLITGGTCAAMRGIGLLHTMGFRNINLFGFDCCREEPTKEERTETTGDIEGGETPKPKYIQVNVKEKTYWTTGELLAMAQDCEKVFQDPGLEGILSFHGENTMVADLWNLRKLQESRPEFKGYYDA